MKKVFALMLFTIASIFAGCEPIIPETVIELSSNNISFEAKGGSADVIIKSNTVWTLQGGADWCTPSAKSGEASTEGTTITFSADVATVDRSTTFRFVCVDKEITLTVTQGGASQILYTTTNGKAMSLPSDINFGVEIISNVYDNNGGVITFNGKLTTIVDKAFKYNHSLKTITIPEDVTTIGKEAFDECYNLISINLPNSITSIGESVFDGCSSLTTITIPESVTTIGAYLFVGCNTLTEFKGKFASADGRCLIVDGVLNSFAPAGLTEYAIPEGVTEIGNAVFAGNREIISITVPEGVTSIGEFAFSDCSNLTTINIPESVTTMGDFAFGFCPKLTAVDIPSGVTEIALGLFKGCHNITKITIPEGVTLIEEQAFFLCSRLKEVYCKPTIPPTLGGDDAFDQYVSDRIIYVPARDDDSIINAYKSAEYWSAELMMEFDFEDNEAIVPNNQIWYSSTSKVIPYDTDVFNTAIVSNEWNPETGNGVITFYSNVTSIGKYAFRECTNLQIIKIPDSVVSIEDSAFTKCTNMTEFKSKLASADGRCLIVDGVLYAFAPAGLTEYAIPEGVTAIGNEVFRGYSSLTNVTIPESVNKIGHTVFEGCTGLLSISIPQGVTVIDGDVFYGCTNLISVTIPDGVTSIGYRSFCECYSITTITLPESLTKIGAYAFSNCSNLISVYCKPLTAPTLAFGDIFDFNASGRKFYVPASDDDSIIEAYKSAKYWSEYAEAIEEYEFD